MAWTLDEFGSMGSKKEDQPSPKGGWSLDEFSSLDTKKEDGPNPITEGFKNAREIIGKTGAGKVAGVIEGAATIGSGLLAKAGGGFAGLLARLHGASPVEAGETVRQAEKDNTYEPTTQTGKNLMEGLGTLYHAPIKGFGEMTKDSMFGKMFPPELRQAMGEQSMETALDVLPMTHGAVRGAREAAAKRIKDAEDAKAKANADLQAMLKQDQDAQRAAQEAQRDSPTPTYTEQGDLGLEATGRPRAESEARIQAMMDEMNRKVQAQHEAVGMMNDMLDVRSAETGMGDMFDQRITAEEPVPSAREGAVDLGQGPVKAGGASEMSNMSSDLFRTPDQMIGEGLGRGRESMRDRALADVAEKTPRLEKRFNRKKHVPMDEEVGRPTNVPDAPFTEMSTSDLIRQRRVQQADEIRAAEGRQMANEDTLPYTGPGARQRGALGSRPDLGQMFRDDAQKGAQELFRRVKSPEAFERELVKHLGEEAKSYAQSLYTWAKQRQSEAGSAPRAATQGAKQNGQAPTAAKKSAAGNALDKFNKWDKRSGAEFRDAMLQKIADGDRKDARLAPYAQGQKHARRHAINQWAYDRMDWNQRTNNLKVRDILDGSHAAARSFIPGVNAMRQKGRGAADPNSIMGNWERLPTKEQKSLLEALHKGDLTNLTAAQRSALDSIQKGFDQAWDKVGTGEKPAGINADGQSLPSDLWNGNYRIWGRSKTDPNRVFVRTVDNNLQAGRAMEALQKEFPDFNFKVQDVVHKAGPSMAHDFPELVKVMGKNDPAMAKVMDDAAYKGKPREYNPRQFATAAEDYISQMVSHFENTKLMKDLNTVLGDDSIKGAYPQAVKSTKNQVDAYFGRDKMADQWLKDRAEDLQRLVGMAPSRGMPKKLIAIGSSALMFFSVMAARVPFYFAQAVQPILILPRMIEQKGLGVRASAIKASMEGLYDFFSGGNKEALTWAREHGVIDPQFAEAMLKSGQSLGMQALQLVTGNRLSAFLDETSRAYAFLAMNRFFENSGMSKVEAREAAAKNSLDIMVEYEAWKRSPVFREMGMVGGLFSPLTTFVNNFFNHIQEYLKDAVRTPNFKAGTKPIAALIGIMLGVSGINGFPFRADADSLVDLINHAFDTKITTPTDMMIKTSEHMKRNGYSRFVHDAVIFGLPSATFGYNMSGTLGAPEIGKSLLPGAGDPLIQLGYKTATETIPTGVRAALGKDISNHDKIDALKPIVPSAPGHGMIERHYSVSKGDSTLVPGKGDFARFKRTPEEQWARYAGMKSTDEAMFDMKDHRLTPVQKRQEESKRDALDIIADKIIFPSDSSRETIRRQMKRYVENGGSPDEVMDTIMKKVENRYETKTQGATEKALESDNPHGLKLLKEFGLIKGERGSHFQKMSNVQSDNLNDSDRQLSLDDFMKTYPKNGTEDERVRFFNKLKQRLEEDRKGSGNIKRYDFRDVDTNDRMPEPSTLDSFERRRSVRKTT
jgi:hypothetical protein